MGTEARPESRTHIYGEGGIFTDLSAKRPDIDPLVQTKEFPDFPVGLVHPYVAISIIRQDRLRREEQKDSKTSASDGRPIVPLTSPRV